MPDKFIAALDLGTNSFHLIIARITGTDDFEIIDRRREVIRLTSQSGNNGSKISADEINMAVKIISEFKTLAQHYNAEIKAVATSAIREASNRTEFINRVLNKTGIKINLIDGRAEAKLIYTGAAKALQFNNRKILCIDIGGGSTEIIHADKGKLLFAESIKIGAVRLSKMFFPDFVLDSEKIIRCKKFVKSEIEKNNNLVFDQDYEFAVGTSGTILSVARMLLSEDIYNTDVPVNKFTIHSSQIDEISEKILSVSLPQDRLKIKNIEAKRADILPAGLIILQTICSLFKIDEIITSEYALREGIILDSIAGKTLL